MIVKKESLRTTTQSVQVIGTVMLLSCFVLMFSYSCRSSNDLYSTDLMSVPPGSWLNIFNGRNLEGWIEGNFNVDDAVKAKYGTLQFAEGKPFTILAWDGNFPTDNFEIEVSAMRLSGNDIFCGLLFPVGDTHVTMVLGGWNNTFVGLSCVNGLYASDNETSLMRQFDNEQWYHVVVRVTEERIVAWVDGEPVIDLERAGRTITPYPGLEALAPFGLFTYATRSALRDLRVRLID